MLAGPSVGSTRIGGAGAKRDQLLLTSRRNVQAHLLVARAGLQVRTRTVDAMEFPQTRPARRGVVKLRSLGTGLLDLLAEGHVAQNERRPQDKPVQLQTVGPRGHGSSLKWRRVCSARGQSSTHQVSIKRHVRTFRLGRLPSAVLRSCSLAWIGDQVKSELRFCLGFGTMGLLWRSP